MYYRYRIQSLKLKWLELNRITTTGYNVIGIIKNMTFLFIYILPSSIVITYFLNNYYNQ